MQKPVCLPSKKASAKLELLSSMLIFGTIGLFVRWIPLPASVIALVRGVVGTAFLLLLLGFKKTRLSLLDIRRNLPLLALSGACIGANWILLFEAYRYTTVATATLCYYLAPVFVLLASPIVLKEKLTLPKLLCAGAALGGMALVSGVFGGGGLSRSEITGVLLGLGAALLYACVILLNKRLRSISPYDATVVQLGSASLVLLPYALLTEGTGWATPAPGVLLLLAIVGVLHTGVAYALYFGSIQRLQGQTVAIFSYLDPVAAILLSALVLREKMDLPGILGAVLILGSTLSCEALDHREKAARSEGTPL